MEQIGSDRLIKGLNSKEFGSSRHLVKWRCLDQRPCAKLNSSPRRSILIPEHYDYIPSYNFYAKQMLAFLYAREHSIDMVHNNSGCLEASGPDATQAAFWLACSWGYRQPKSWLWLYPICSWDDMQTKVWRCPKRSLIISSSLLLSKIAKWSDL